jgi:hypothetical protein
MSARVNSRGLPGHRSPKPPGLGTKPVPTWMARSSVAWHADGRREFPPLAPSAHALAGRTPHPASPKSLVETHRDTHMCGKRGSVNTGRVHDRGTSSWLLRRTLRFDAMSEGSHAFTARRGLATVPSYNTRVQPGLPAPGREPGIKSDTSLRPGVGSRPCPRITPETRRIFPDRPENLRSRPVDHRSTADLRPRASVQHQRPTGSSRIDQEADHQDRRGPSAGVNPLPRASAQHRRPGASSLSGQENADPRPGA